MPSLRPGEAAGEFTDVTGTDQLARGQVTGRRQYPVVAGCAAAPDPPLRVLAPEPLEPGILVVPAGAAGHGARWPAAASRVAGGWGRDGRIGTAATSLAAGSGMPASREPGTPGPGRPGTAGGGPVISLSTGGAGAEQVWCGVTAGSPARRGPAGRAGIRRHRRWRGPPGEGRAPRGTRPSTR